MNKFSLLTIAALCVIIGVSSVKAAWTVIYDPYTKRTSMVYVPDRPCPHNHYNPYNPYYPYPPTYRPYPYHPAPVYQFNFNKNHDHHKHKNHHKKPCK